MRLSIVTTVMMTLLSFESGCSWIWWNHVPDRNAPAEKIECSKGGPIADTVAAGLFAISTGVAVGVFTHPDCKSGDDMCGLSVLGALYLGIPLGVLALVSTAAAISGWANYSNCREYQERVSAYEQLGTGPELFHPSSANPETPNPSSPPTEKLDGDSK